MAEATPHDPLTPAQVATIQEYLDRRNAQIEEYITEATKAIDAKIAAALEGAVKVGDAVALKAANGQFVCAQDGGPKKTGAIFEFQSRDIVGPHELYIVTK